MSELLPSGSLHELQRRIDELSDKFDDMSEALTDIKIILSKQEGIGLPKRVHQLEERLRATERWQFIVTGGLIAFQILLTVLGRFIVDKLYQ